MKKLKQDKYNVYIRKKEYESLSFWDKLKLHLWVNMLMAKNIAEGE